MDVQITSANAAAARSVSIGFYTDAVCSLNEVARNFAAYEFSPLAAGTLIYRTAAEVLTSRNHRYSKIITNTGGTSTGVLVYRDGYFD